jgi:hypothetical protein
MKRYALLVRWGTRIERFEIEPTNDGQLPVLFIGKGKVRSACKLHDEGGAPIGILYTRGNEDPDWIVAAAHSDTGEPVIACSGQGDPNLQHYLKPDDETTSPNVEHAITTDQLSSLLALVDADKGISENDGRRIHAFADYVTGLDLLNALILHELSDDSAWMKPGVVEGLVARAQNYLQVLLANGHYLASTRADAIDLRSGAIQSGAWLEHAPRAKA